jgi:hypothetical protein
VYKEHMSRKKLYFTLFLECLRTLELQFISNNTYLKYLTYSNSPPGLGIPILLFFECFSDNEENSPTFDRRVSPLVGAATQESNVWVLSVKGRKKEK